MGGLTPEDQDHREGEFVEDLFWEFFDLIAQAVADGATHPLFDQMSGDLLRIGVEAGVVSPSESGVARGRHSGLASDLLQRLPLFEKATVQDILAIRRELEGPLVRFPEGLQPPDIIAAEIVENLEAALEQFSEIHEELRIPATD